VRPRLFAVALVLLCAPFGLRAQTAAAGSPSGVDQSLTSVVSGGSWRIGARRGTFRLLVFGRGWRHERSRLVVEWLETQPAKQRTVLYSARDIEAIPGEAWALDPPRLEFRDRSWYATVTGTTDGGRIRRTWRFELASPGVVREVRPR
jgi:hypothetical protein